MRWLRFPPVAAAVLLLGLLGAGPAAAQPDHLHADLSLVACDTLQATGFELPAFLSDWMILPGIEPM